MDRKQQAAARLVQEARKGSLRSPRSIVFYLLALVYILSPLDFIPDALLGVGQLDDGAVLVALLWYVVRLWRQNRAR